jgi:hypothetical protein
MPLPAAVRMATFFFSSDAALVLVSTLLSFQGPLPSQGACSCKRGA